jgi:hypothetical protein
MTDTSAVDTAAPTAAPATSIFQNIENEVVADVKEAVAEVEQFWTDDVKPILSAVLTYIEQNGGADLLTIAENAFTAAVSGLETGTSAADVTTAVVATVIDEGKSAGIQIAEGAANLAVSLAAAKANATATPAADSAQAVS